MGWESEEGSLDASSVVRDGKDKVLEVNRLEDPRNGEGTAC